MPPDSGKSKILKEDTNGIYERNQNLLVSKNQIYTGKRLQETVSRGFGVPKKLKKISFKHLDTLDKRKPANLEDGFFPSKEGIQKKGISSSISRVGNSAQLAKYEKRQIKSKITNSEMLEENSKMQEFLNFWRKRL